MSRKLVLGYKTYEIRISELETNVNKSVEVMVPTIDDIVVLPKDDIIMRIIKGER